MRPALHHATRALLRERLEALGAAPVLPFAEAVVHQAAHSLGAVREADAPDAAAARERAVATALLDALGTVAQRASEGALDAAAARLTADVSLLAACYQNLDLLPAVGDAASDAVALLVGRAVERLAAPAPA